MVKRGCCRLRTVMGKILNGYEYDVDVEVVDESHTVHHFKWDIYCSKDMKTQQLVIAKEFESSVSSESINLVKEKEKIILLVREELI